MQPDRHRAVVDPKLGTDPAERPAGGIKLGSSVHIHNQHPNFRRKPSTSARTRWYALFNSRCSGLHCRGRRRVERFFCGGDGEPLG
jgi:hypothetical protein